MRRYDTHEFTGSDDLGLFPEPWKMPLVAGNQVVSAGGVSALQEVVVVRIPGDLEPTHWVHKLRMILYELEKLLAKASSDLEFPARKNFAVFRQNCIGDVEPGGFGQRNHKYCALKSVRFQSRRNDDMCVDDEPERNHRRFGFCARVALMTRSIWLDLSLFVPFRRDSIPISASTSGSGAARRT